MGVVWEDAAVEVMAGSLNLTPTWYVFNPLETPWPDWNTDR